MSLDFFLLFVVRPPLEQQDISQETKKIEKDKRKHKVKKDDGKTEHKRKKEKVKKQENDVNLLGDVLTEKKSKKDEKEKRKSKKKDKDSTYKPIFPI